MLYVHARLLTVLNEATVPDVLLPDKSISRLVLICPYGDANTSFSLLPSYKPATLMAMLAKLFASVTEVLSRLIKRMSRESKSDALEVATNEGLFKRVTCPDGADELNKMSVVLFKLA